MLRRFLATFAGFLALYGGMAAAQLVANYAFEHCIPSCSATVPAWYSGGAYVPPGGYDGP